MSRVLLFTGKGGVGKTTVAAATALRCADAGQRTIVLSTDPAHSLADAFGLPLGSVASPVADGLWAQQLDAAERLEDAWGEIQDFLVEVFEWAGLAAIEAEELSVLPGLDEIFALADIKAYADSGDWDVVVVDCAPTAETIRLLSLPEILSWYMDRVFPAGRALTKLTRPVLSRLTAMPVAGDQVFSAAARFYDRLDGVRELLTDTTRSSVRLVVNPERMVIAEARRTATYLSLFGYGVDAVIANRILPDDISDPWFKAWKEAHAEHLTAIVEGFAPVPVLRAHLASQELVGVDDLRQLGAALYDTSAPEGVLSSPEPVAVRRDGSDWILSIELPFTDRDDLDVGRRDGELLIRVGAHRRSMVLPDTLRHLPVEGATMVGRRLEISFGGQNG